LPNSVDLSHTDGIDFQRMVCEYPRRIALILGVTTLGPDGNYRASLHTIERLYMII